MSAKEEHWALILGGSSGFGLATARKLATEGMHLAIVHRDRRSVAKQAELEFESFRAQGVKVVSFNADALNPEQQTSIIADIKAALGEHGAVRLLMHSIAFGNLLLAAPEVNAEGPSARSRLAERLGIEEETLGAAVDELFADDVYGLAGLATPSDYSSATFLDDESMANTVYSMGTSLLTWTQAVHSAGLFASDARVLGMTSEGNTVAWKSYAAVSAAKTALEAVSRSIAVEFASYGIRSNIIQAGVTDTPALRLIPGHRQLMANARMRNPMRRLTRPEDVANVISLLCKPEAAWINGTIIRVDGGEHISGG